MAGTGPDRTGPARQTSWTAASWRWQQTPEDDSPSVLRQCGAWKWRYPDPPPSLPLVLANDVIPARFKGGLWSRAAKLCVAQPKRETLITLLHISAPFSTFLLSRMTGCVASGAWTAPSEQLSQAHFRKCISFYFLKICESPWESFLKMSRLWLRFTN